MKNLTKYEEGWLAGIIDGEGSLIILKEKRPHFTSGYAYHPVLNIGNSNFNIIKEIHRLTDGKIHEVKNRKNQQEKFWIINIYSNKLRDLLPRVMLVGKKKQKDLIIEALDILKIPAGRKKPRTKKIIQKLESIIYSIRKLNLKKGWYKRGK